jgi:DNA invertase Pin-like site-specific DNA recombinase
MEVRMRVVGYVRVSTSEQGESGAGLEAQRATIKAMCAARGWTLAAVHEDIASGKSRKQRPSLEAALEACERGDADGVVVAKLDRLSRSMLDFAQLLENAKRKGYVVAAVDIGVDTSTSNGKLVANVVMSVAEWERERICERTRDALAVKKRQGARLGRRPTLPAKLRRRIARDRAGGLSYRAIADRLNAEGVPTAQGGRQWYAATVRTALMVAAR